MSKLFKELESGDKIYELELYHTRLRWRNGASFMSSSTVRSVNKTSAFGGLTHISVTLERGTVIYPDRQESDSYIFINSRDTSIYNALNANVYGTSKRACLEAAINAIHSKTQEQKEACRKLKETIDENMITVDVLEKKLETADFPDTVLEFAEMALD